MTRDWMQTFERLSLEALGRYSYNAVGPAGERHGAWEMTFCRSGEDRLDRFVIASAAEMQSSVDFEFRAGAQSGRNFCRKLISSFSLAETELEAPTWVPILEAHLRSAAEIADGFSPGDLTEAYRFGDEKSRVASQGVGGSG